MSIPHDPVQPAREDLHQIAVPPLVRSLLYGVFLWCLLGISAGYGMRFWNDSPVHPSFLPLIGVAFASILAFSVVMAFRSVAGEVQLELASIKFRGASGPVFFWALCFLVVCTGGHLLGMAEVVNAPAAVHYWSCGAWEVARARCDPQLQNGNPSAASPARRQEQAAHRQVGLPGSPRSMMPTADSAVIRSAGGFLPEGSSSDPPPD